jgi:predicted phage-related endonuclease
MEIGRKFDRQQWVLHPSGLLSATLDGVRLDGEGDPFIVEAKTTSLTEGWGEPGTDAVPEKVLIQVHHQFLCVGPTVRVCYIPVLLIGYRGAEVQLYKVYRNDRLCEIVEAAGLAFMASVKNHTPPPEPPSLEVVERIQRTPKKAVTIHEELVERWLSAKAIEKSAAEQCEAARRDLLAALGDAEIGESSAGTVTYGETKSNRFDLSRFKQDQPVLAEQYLTTSTYRVLRHKAAK